MRNTTGKIGDKSATKIKKRNTIIEYLIKCQKATFLTFIVVEGANKNRVYRLK